MVRNASWDSDSEYANRNGKLSVWKCISVYVFNSWINNNTFTDTLVSFLYAVLFTFVAKFLYIKKIFIKL